MSFSQCCHQLHNQQDHQGHQCYQDYQGLEITVIIVVTLVVTINLSLIVAKLDFNIQGEIWQTVLLDQPGHTCDTNRQAKMYHRHYMDLFADVWPDSLLSREGSHYSSKMDIKILIAGKL